MEIREGINQNDKGTNIINKVALSQFIFKKNVEGSNEENKLVIIFNYN